MIILGPLCILLLALIYVYSERREKQCLLRHAKGFISKNVIQQPGEGICFNQNGSKGIIVSQFNCITRQVLPIDHDTIPFITEDLKFIKLPGFVQYIDSVVEGSNRVRYFREAGYLFCFFPWQQKTPEYKLLVFVRKSSGFESLIFNKRFKY